MADASKAAEGNVVWKAMKPFVTGSISGSIATCCIQPIDMVKVRIQLNAQIGASQSPLAVGSQLIKEDGFLSLYRGLSAGLTRQVVYTGARLGLYDVFTEQARGKDGKLSGVGIAGCALAAGGLAAIIGNPADLALIRMQADSMLPEAERRGYKHVFDALGRIAAEEGASGLFKGAAATSTRAMALNLGMLGGNTKSKAILSDMGVEGNLKVFGASAIAGFFAAFFSLPFDYVKTQIQQQKPGPDGKLPFNGPIDCAIQTFKNGGITRFWAGFPTFYVRIAPHAMITLLAQDKVKQLWSSMGC